MGASLRHPRWRRLDVTTMTMHYRGRRACSRWRNAHLRNAGTRHSLPKCAVLAMVSPRPGRIVRQAYAFMDRFGHDHPPHAAGSLPTVSLDPRASSGVRRAGIAMDKSLDQNTCRASPSFGRGSLGAQPIWKGRPPHGASAARGSRARRGPRAPSQLRPCPCCPAGSRCRRRRGDAGCQAGEGRRAAPIPWWAKRCLSCRPK